MLTLAAKQKSKKETLRNGLFLVNKFCLITLTIIFDTHEKEVDYMDKWFETQIS